jgi:preprotein translocase subunit SecB
MTDSSRNEQSPRGPNPAGNGSDATNGAPPAGTRHFGMRHVYVKDMSFEAPNSPGILTEGGLDPEIKLNLRSSHRELGSDMAEVVLHVAVHALAGQRTMFLVELEQAGAFQISGFPPEETRAIVGVACPNALFPYAREAVASLVQRGGFAQLLLQPIDFAALFAHAEANRATSTAPAGQA